MKKGIILLVASLTIISLCSCGISFSNRAVKNILKENNYLPDSKSIKVEKILNFEKLYGVESIDNYKLVLINDNNNYDFAVINTETHDVTVPSFNYAPLDAIMEEVCNSNKTTNVECMNILKMYIEEYGKYIDNKLIAKDYLREITGDDGIISTSRAQDVIRNSITQIFPDIDADNDVSIYFEDDSALPICFLMHSTEMSYNWTNIFDESVYKVWEANTDIQTQNTMIALYGSPYVFKDVWTLLDNDFNVVKTYDSLEEFNEDFSE